MANYFNMYGHEAHANYLQMYQTGAISMSETYGMMTQSSNRYIYLKQSPNQNITTNSVIHVNPHFNKKVFVNPNFQASSNIVSTIPKIHINPNIQNMNFTANKIHINPNILKTDSSADLISNSMKTLIPNVTKGKEDEIQPTVYSSRTKLIRAAEKTVKLLPSPKKTKNAINTKFKLVKSQVENKKLKTPSSKYKLVRYKFSPEKKKIMNKFKLDNRIKRSINSVSLQAKNIISKHKLIRVGRENKQSTSSSEGLYKKTANSLKKSPTVKKLRRSSILNYTICKSKYKIVKSGSLKSRLLKGGMSMVCNKNIKSPKQKIRVLKNKKVSAGKLRKCNIPCPYFRKFGKCRGFDNGKCFRKHDPDQIALCTKFLQGACINEKCLLSHNVSPEKMPTCKFYLEGACSRDQCPYLHVRLSPKTDICKDFLEGFCGKGAECNKRHQYLCPEYEKTGNCLKQVCPYPHGKMVRKYSVIDKYKFAKKCSDDENLSNKEMLNKERMSNNSNINTENIKEASKNRYYINQVVEDHPNSSNYVDKTTAENISNTAVCMKTRPKLGSLPSFIAFEDI